MVIIKLLYGPAIQLWVYTQRIRSNYAKDISAFSCSWWYDKQQLRHWVKVCSTLDEGIMKILCFYTEESFSASKKKWCPPIFKYVDQPGGYFFSKWNQPGKWPDTTFFSVTFQRFIYFLLMWMWVCLPAMLIYAMCIQVPTEATGPWFH